MAGVTPSALEFMDRAAVDYTINLIDGANLAMNGDVSALLLIEVDGNNTETLMEDLQKIIQVAEQHNCDEAHLGP